METFLQKARENRWPFRAAFCRSLLVTDVGQTLAPAFRLVAGTLTQPAADATQLVGNLVSKAVGDGLSLGLDKLIYGHAASAGSFVAPWAQVATAGVWGGDPRYATSFYRPGAPGYAGSNADGLDSQLSGVASAAAGHAFSLGQFGGTVTYEHNDELQSSPVEAALTNAEKSAENGYIEGEPNSGVRQIGLNGVAPATAQKLGLTLRQAQEALDEVRSLYDLGDVSQVPFIITETGDIYAPGGVAYYGKLQDHVPFDNPQNVVNGVRLADQLRLEPANSPFTPNGELTQSAIPIRSRFLHRAHNEGALRVSNGQSG